RLAILVRLLRLGMRGSNARGRKVGSCRGALRCAREAPPATLLGERLALGLEIGDRRAHVGNDGIARRLPKSIAAQFEVPPTAAPRPGELADPAVNDLRRQRSARLLGVAQH